MVREWIGSASLLFVMGVGVCAPAFGQVAEQKAAGATSATTIVQPGAPGQPSKVLTPETARTPLKQPTQADIDFMQGMIMHHGQAVEMTELLKARGKDPDVREMGRRIDVSQTAEMGYMKRWLEERCIPTKPKGGDMAGMDMSGDMAGMDMGGMDMPKMPGMLTAKQMTALKAAHGAAFDKLFLTGMIQHHTGALTMVTELLNAPGAAQDPVLFDFAADVENGQTAEIRIMQGSS